MNLLINSLFLFDLFNEVLERIKPGDVNQRLALPKIEVALEGLSNGGKRSTGPEPVPAGRRHRPGA